MRKIKQHKFMCIGIIVLGVILLGMSAVYAEDRSQDQGNEALEQIMANREAVILDLAERWAAQSEESVESLSQTFHSATNDQLLAIDEADSYEDVLEVLGDVNKDFVYTPVTPCKIVDTRYGGGGFIYSGQTRGYFVHGNCASQGGTTCTAPRGEPRAVHISMAAVDPNGKGNIKAFPYGASGDSGLTVNFAPIGTNINNAGTVQTAYNVGSDIGVKASYAGCHATIQVLGYYYPVNSTHIVETGQGGFDYWSLLIDSISYQFVGALSGSTTLTLDGGEDVLVIGSAQIFKNQSIASNHIEGTIKACYKKDGNIVTGNGYNTESDFCFSSSGKADQRSVQVSGRFNNLSAGTYEFGICAKKGSSFACFADEVNYEVAATKINVIKTKDTD